MGAMKQAVPMKPTAVSANDVAGPKGTTTPPPSKVAAATGSDTLPDPADELPIIQADQRINAVLIRDLPARMAQYEQLIRTLDVRPAMIEIEAHIIEVSTDEASKIGVDWSTARNANGNAKSLQYGDPTLPLPPPTGDFPRAGMITAMVASQSQNILARITALSQDGKANISASPKVLTLNNLEALMDNVESFYVRVAGTYSAELFNISTGVTLHVTPLIVTEGEQKRIKLDVRIEDGRLSTDNVDQIPVVRKSEINTQAFINDGEALLIAGYTLDQQSKTRGGVPGLSKIPLLGRLFRYDTESKSKMQRMFMLTPRIVVEQVVAEKGGGTSGASLVSAPEATMKSAEPPVVHIDPRPAPPAPAMLPASAEVASTKPAAPQPKLIETKPKAPDIQPAAQPPEPLRPEESASAGALPVALIERSNERSSNERNRDGGEAVNALGLNFAPERDSRSARPEARNGNCHAATAMLGLCDTANQARPAPPRKVPPAANARPPVSPSPAPRATERTAKAAPGPMKPAVENAAALPRAAGNGESRFDNESSRRPAHPAAVSRAAKASCPAAMVVLGTCTVIRKLEGTLEE